MFLNDRWSYLVVLQNERGQETGMCLVDLSSEDDRGDVEPFVDELGRLRCTVGVKPTDDEPENERLEIKSVYEYWDDMPFNNKFPFFGPVTLRDFVRSFCDAGRFDNLDEDEIIELKKHYGVFLHYDVQISEALKSLKKGGRNGQRLDK